MASSPSYGTAGAFVTVSAVVDEKKKSEKVLQMIAACEQGQLHVIQALLQENALYARWQDESTGRAPLMAAAAAGNHALCQHLLDAGAPWNAVDRQGLCAGNYATQHQHWAVVNLLVEWGVRAELILGTVERQNHHQLLRFGDPAVTASDPKGRPVEHEPSTKPDYLRQRLVYTDDGRALLDSDKDAVMMEWERPLMKAHAQILMQNNPGRTVLNVGFGMGIIDSILQAEHQPTKHYIVEAHPDVHRRMLAEKWHEKPGVEILFGKWQDVLPALIQQGTKVDAAFFDTYGEHYLDLEDFHALLPQLLQAPHGVYSFFNGLAPDNLFFHGVACQCVKLQLAQKGLDAEFLECQIQVPDTAEWHGIRRQYWHGRDTYYLPRCTWNADFLATGRVAAAPGDDEATKAERTDKDVEMEPPKRPRV